MNKPVRTYSERDLGVEALVGRTIKAAFINPHNDAVLLKTDDGAFYLSWQGDCCASCFIAHISGSDFLIDATILTAENTEWSALGRSDDDVVDAMGTKFRTTKGYIDIETRVSHNGYYGGMINVSRNGYIDAYSCLIEIDNVDQPLKDF